MWCPNFEYKPAIPLRMQGITERESNKQPADHKNSLNAVIVEALPKTSMHYLIETCSRYRSKIESVIEDQDALVQLP